MKIKKFTILFLFIFNTCGISQQFNLGFRSEVGYINYEIGNESKAKIFIIPIQNISLTFDLNLSKQTYLQLRPSLMLTQYNYEGFELGAFFFNKFIPHNISANIGLNFHFNSNKEGNSGGTGETASFIVMGLGYNLSDNFSLEISDHIPIKGKYGFFEYNRSYLYYQIKNIFKFGFSIII